MARGTTKERQGRSATSLTHVLHKRKRYDPNDAKRQRFYASAKQFKSYQRLLRREGIAQPPPLPTAAPLDEEEEDVDEEKRAQPFENGDRKRRREEREGMDGDRREDGEEEGEAKGDEVREAGVEVRTGGKERMQRQRKQRRVAPVRKTKEELRAEAEAKARALAEAKEARMQSFKRHMARTKRGQPIMSNLMEDLLSKLRKQKQQNAAPKPRSSAPSAAS